MTDRSKAPRASSSATASSARSRIVPSRGITARTGSTAASPMTFVICGVRSVMSTKRRPSLPIASKSTRLSGPHDTVVMVGGDGYAGSMTSFVRSVRCLTLSKATSAAAVMPRPVMLCATHVPVSPRSEPITFSKPA